MCYDKGQFDKKIGTILEAACLVIVVASIILASYKGYWAECLAMAAITVAYLSWRR